MSLYGNVFRLMIGDRKMEKSALQLNIDASEAQYYDVLARAEKAIAIDDLAVAMVLLQYAKYLEIKIRHLEAQKLSTTACLH